MLTNTKIENHETNYNSYCKFNYNTYNLCPKSKGIQRLFI